MRSNFARRYRDCAKSCEPLTKSQMVDSALLKRVQRFHACFFKEMPIRSWPIIIESTVRLDSTTLLSAANLVGSLSTFTSTR
jgi:hypothetical protein